MMHGSKPNGSPTAHLLQSLLKLLAKRWKGVTVSVILVVGTIGFTQIELTGGERLNLIESFYETLRLFILSASGTPVDGSKIWLYIMWFLYLLAAALSATFLVESLRTIKQALDNPDRIVRKMKDHLILCGRGKHGRLIVSQVLARNPGQDVVIVEVDTSLPPFLEFATGMRVPVIVGDMTDAMSLRRAGIERARRLYAASGNDVANLNTCILAKECAAAADFKSVALISDVDLSRGVSDLARSEGVVLVNPYEIAGTNLVEELWSMMGSSNGGISFVVVAGFGRFGQMFTKALLRKAGDDCKLSVAVVDRMATKKVEVFRRSFDIGDRSLSAIDGDVDDPRVFETALTRGVSGTSATEPIVILCTDNDTANLNTALLLQECWKVTATVVTRLFNPPPGFCKLIAGSRIHAFQIPKLIEKKLPEECF